MKRILLALVCAVVVGCDKTPNADFSAGAQNAQAAAAPENTAPDNTARNTPDRNSESLTPEDQIGSEADRKITQAIRKSVVIEPGQDEHSVLARNVKIVTQDGVVTLRGVVRSEAEKTDIETRARSVAGVKNVNNQLEIKAKE